MVTLHTYPRETLAQEIFGDDKSLKLEASPLVVSLATQPGTSVTTKIKIKNGGQISEDIRVGLMKFGAYGDKGAPVLMERESGDEYFDWISFSENKFTLYPEESKIITATIKVPREASFGYYYAVTFARDSGGDSTKSGETALVGSVASLILLEAKVPNAKREVELVDFSIGHGVYEFLPTSFDIKVKNVGNVHLVPTGNVFIESESVKDLAILPINPASGSVLPSTNRVFNVKWKDGFPTSVEKTKAGKVILDKNNKAVEELMWDIKDVNKFRFGRYHASLVLTYDDGTRDQVIESKISFWVIPWRILAAVAVVVIIMLAGVYSIVRSIFSPPRSR